MRSTHYLPCITAALLTACSITQKPAMVSGGDDVTSPAAVTTQVVEAPVVAPVRPLVTADASVAKQTISLSAIPGIAKTAQKNPQAAKKYVGETLTGHAKFVKAPKGNPNAVVADVRVSGLGEVSLWCRNVLGAAPANKAVSFEGVLSGSVYTSEDFSHDVTMKDCRFHE